jgi:hypothetical protein
VACLEVHVGSVHITPPAGVCSVVRARYEGVPSHLHSQPQDLSPPPPLPSPMLSPHCSQAAALAAVLRHYVLAFEAAVAFEGGGSSPRVMWVLSQLERALLNLGLSAEHLAAVAAAFRAPLDGGSQHPVVLAVVQLEGRMRNSKGDSAGAEACFQRVVDGHVAYWRRGAAPADAKVRRLCV